MTEQATAGEPARKFGTFLGVYTPSVLTILGIILFLRLAHVVGNAGLGRALLIIGLANIISVLTSVSLSAIATNLRVKGGGDYYLISRTLGLQFGGSIGIVLYLALFGSAVEAIRKLVRIFRHTEAYGRVATYVKNES